MVKIVNDLRYWRHTTFGVPLGCLLNLQPDRKVIKIPMITRVIRNSAKIKVP
ncbi:MAG: hypothetical protein LBJ67_08250 [Planctomycetaceae bacterium]|nr:hypothetical protein [Planctomycetaceae bacterium]